MKKRFLFIVVAILVQLGCANPSSDGRNLTKQLPSCSIISEQTAKLIAQGELQTSFVDSKFDISVLDKGDNWEVRFATKCVDCEDGHPYVIVNKASGDVVQVFPYGEPAESGPNQ